MQDKNSKSRAIVLLTDGENNAGKIPPSTAAEAVKALHIKLYAIGAGINGIAPVPVMTAEGGPLTDMMGKKNAGAPRPTKSLERFIDFNDAGLQAEVARDRTGGGFFRASRKQLEKSLRKIY